MLSSLYCKYLAFPKLKASRDSKQYLEKKIKLATIKSNHVLLLWRLWVQASWVFVGPAFCLLVSPHLPCGCGCLDSWVSPSFFSTNSSTLLIILVLWFKILSISYVCEFSCRGRLLLTCICPCCLCVTIIVEFALALIKAPIVVMEWFISKIPC